MNKLPLKIHYSLLPKKLKDIKQDEYGFVHGFFHFNDLDYTAEFCDNDSVLFGCSRPIVMAHTHLFVKYIAVVYTSYDKKGEQCELIMNFN